MNEAAERGRYRVVRGGFRPQGVKWASLALGSTNRLWRGSGPTGDWLFKWYRYPQTGVHPEVEMAEFLALQPEIGVATFGAKVEQWLAGEWVVVGLIQQWVEGHGAWEKVVADLSGGQGDEMAARRWGQTVGALHRVLASGAAGAFTSEPWEQAECVAWSQRVEAIGGQLLEALRGERPKEADVAVWERARKVWVKGEVDWRRRARALGQLSVTGRQSRVHGDLHLGQILDSSQGKAVVVDFEGEPLRALEDRRARDLPLRDVAGMWRSFAYAGVVSGAGELAVEPLQTAFLDGWKSQMSLPEGNWQAVFAGLVWEKAIYETLYELRHRPTWLGVPLSAI